MKHKLKDIDPELNVEVPGKKYKTESATFVPGVALASLSTTESNAKSVKAKKGKVQENDIMPQLVDYLMINKEVALANDFQNGKDIILKLSHPLQKSGANLLASVLKTNTKNIITLDLGGLNIKSPELTKLLTSLKSSTTVREIKVYDRDLRNASAIIKN